MGIDRATIVVVSSFRATRELGGVVSLLDGADEDIKMALSKAIYDIMEDIVSPILEAHPSLKKDVEERMEKFGRAF